MAMEGEAKDSPLLPPRKVEARRLVKSPLSLDTNISKLPPLQFPSVPQERSKAPGVVGKSDEKVLPVTYTFPPESRAMELPTSSSLPPRKVEARRVVKFPLRFDTNAVRETLEEVSKAPGVVGKSDESVKPVTYTFPPESMARRVPKNPSSSLPPRKVEAIRSVKSPY
jgi:hypothetical protein